MKKLIVPAALALLLAGACSKDEGTVKIQLPDNFKESTLVVSHVTIDNIFTATKQDDLKVIYDTLQVKDGVARLTLDPAGAARYNIEPPVISRMEPDFYAAPGETLVVDIKSFEPLDFSVSGTPLMDDMTRYRGITQPIQQEYMALVENNDSVSEEQVKAIMTRYDESIKKFVADNPASHAVPFAILD
ncbi:MAG: hypothetical protein K2G69_05720, partial [Muribaculaceae bacterium]|nr:hypothetical protein [Muribaculaceae bacterium]